MIIPVVALIGVGLAVALVLVSMRGHEPADPIAAPVKSQFHNYVSGSGIVEASSDNINIGTEVSGVVDEVYVDVGDIVEKGEPLFRLDDRELQARLRRKEAEVIVSEARVSEAQALLADAGDRLRLVQSLTDRRALSKEELDRRRRAVEITQTQLRIAEANLNAAIKEREAVEVDLERLTVRSPISCRVLQINVDPGEYAVAGKMEEPLMMIGCDSPLHVRVDIDEHDAWRFDPNGAATGALRGNPAIWVDLELVRVEPFVIPKKSLVGNGNGRVDTRVLQVVYRFDPGDLPIYIGQQMDVSMEAKPDATP